MKDTCDIESLPYVYKANNYHYIGGSYGQCSEKKLMTELSENGPIVVSFEPDYNFMMYKSGIYHSIDEKTWISKRLPKPEWEKVDHSVLLVGWGEDEKTNVKCWIIQNTWVPNCGEEGLFRMKRGVDEFGIESICEAADPYILERNTNRLMTKKDMEEANKRNYNGRISRSQFNSNRDEDLQSPSMTNNNNNNYFEVSNNNNNNNNNNNENNDSNSIINQLDNLDIAVNDSANNPDIFKDDSGNSLFQTLD